MRKRDLREVKNKRQKHPLPEEGVVERRRRSSKMRMTFSLAFPERTFPKSLAANYWTISSIRSGKSERRPERTPNKFSKTPK